MIQGPQEFVNKEQPFEHLLRILSSTDIYQSQGTTCHKVARQRLGSGAAVGQSRTVEDPI
ncbi:hypothetical protein F444_20630 [Phytophthora nicotianae P1976]|uniref:Uncharacterized protein n=1 Tax=Phytophthora nicotianae P1976 TaxID=1317066 RepID=A0A080Z3Z0_PHYNI|nr:hypothetical protein F444_20630 [Phytophthora nicotianae P1976]